MLATGNADKLRMLDWLLEDLPLDPVTPADIGISVSPDESGDTHESIARSKAEAWSLAAGMPAIATDGGLLVPALGANWESRYTRRFAGPAADDAARQRRLLGDLGYDLRPGSYFYVPPDQTEVIMGESAAAAE